MQKISVGFNFGDGQPPKFFLTEIFVDRIFFSPKFLKRPFYHFFLFTEKQKFEGDNNRKIMLRDGSDNDREFLARYSS